ncbi:protein Shroom3 isoform X2 [Mastacembelus armatus]|uniref:Shroom family member 3 n=1 Tax=Mastacembelus armatus TaxID=205130 RepID=A0A3Q3ND92_9TELE|nr:protein Shroom3-like isoform X2 [Mastacembelus armatus]
MESGRAGLQQAAGGGRGSGWVLLEARLQGGAPWGFTLQGGLEHGEPLIISKVEEGGKADSLEQPLLEGDEIIIINDVELTGYRQEAIALVKGSYKTLQLTVRREFDPGYVEEFGISSPSLPALSPPSLPPLSSPPPTPQEQQQTPLSSHRSRSCSAGGVQLRIKNRRSEPASRPHSWHSTKLSESQQESEEGKMDTMSSTWHHSYHASASTTDLSGGFDSGISYLRKSPDQYSSRGSMESLDHPQSSQLHSGAQHHHPLGHHTHSGPHLTYSSCHQLSSARSSNSIDHLHSKRDSAYSSFSTSSSIPEYLASTPSFSPERSYSLETVSQRGGGSGEMHQADMRYARTVYDKQQGLSQEHELSSAALLHNSDFRGGGGVRPGLNRELQGSVGGVCYRASNSSGSSSSGGVPASNRHSVGPIWGPATSHSSYESLKGAPALPKRSDSYAAIRNHERPNSWSSLEHARSLRSLQKGSWPHSSGPVVTGAAKSMYATEGYLHTVIEKSPESSPTTKPRQGGAIAQPPSLPEPTAGSVAPIHESSRLILPTGMCSAPQPEPHYAQMPCSNPGRVSPRVYPALARESNRLQHQGLQGISGNDETTTEGLRDGKICTTQNGYQNNPSSSPYPQSSYSTLASSQHWTQTYDEERSVDEISIYSDPVSFCRPAQGQGQTPHLPVDPQSQVPPTSVSHSSPSHPSTLPALQYQNWDHKELEKDTEHPLTRLENALAEVQRCASPDNVFSSSTQVNSSFGDDNKGPARSLSVLEKVICFERRERARKQRSHSTSNTNMTEKDLRNMLARSTSGTRAYRTMSYRGGSCDHMQYRTLADPKSALQRSRSSFQLDNSREGNSSKDSPLRHDIQEMLGSMQDTSFNRSYRDSLKDAQSKVLQSTSFIRKDLSSSVSHLPPAASPPMSFSSTDEPSPVPAQHHSLEKKGPKTMPKPQGIIITPQSPPQVTSPHTPKERHAVSPEIKSTCPPSLPSVPPVGPSAPMQICGRKRLTVDQKKRSYSVPENMNEVGVSDTETSAFFRRGGETSVVEKKKMFELVASRVRSGAPQNTTSRPDLRRLQHNALAEYVERKRSIKREDGEQRSELRPHSAYLQPDNSNHTVSSCYSDTLSLSSASSLLSLQDSVADQNSSSGERRICTPLPPGADLRSFQSNLFYPGRVTTPRPPALSPPSARPGYLTKLHAQTLQNLTPEAGFSRHSQSLSKDPRLDHKQQASGPQLKVGQFKQLSGVLQSSKSSRSSSKSASAEDLLERSEQKQTTSQHYRSRSSPTVESLNQDVPPGDTRMFDEFLTESGHCSPAKDRPTDIQVSGDLITPQPSQKSLNTVQDVGPCQDPGSCYTPFTRRERQRNSERQRAHSTSTLAASVGLPCPFSPPGTEHQSGTKWQASERLSLTNLDAIAFPGILQINMGDADGSRSAATHTADCSETLVTGRQTRHSLSTLEDPEKDVYRGRTYSLEIRGGHSAGSVKQVSLATQTPLSHVQLTAPPNKKDTQSTTSSPSSTSHLPSLRISESSLFGSIDEQKTLETSTSLSQEDFDEVFLQTPNPPPPPPPIEETSIMEDFPPPPSPLYLEQETKYEILGSPTSELLNNPCRKSPLQSPPLSPSSTVIPPPSLLPSLMPQPSTIITSITNEDSLSLEYKPLPMREKTSEELRVEMLARQLVLQDCSLAPLLDTWGGKSTIELMEEIFPNNRLVGTSQSQQKHTRQLDNRIHSDICESAPRPTMDGGRENNLDEEKDLNTRKVELCEALKRSVAALQQEKEALCEEQRHHQALGASIEMLVQKHLKTNESDKYNMFIGDLEKIVNLLLSLCSRLSRIDRALLTLGTEELAQEELAEERDSLHHKRSLLLRQTEDARELKENLDRRQRVVQAILSGYLTEPQLQKYRHFVSTKPSLMIRRRHLEDLIRQEEEQLIQLAESLSVDSAGAHGWSRASSFSGMGLLPCSPLPPLHPTSVQSVRSTTVTAL